MERIAKAMYLIDGKPSETGLTGVTHEQARERTMAYRILRGHNMVQEKGRLHMRFDAMVSHDITYVGIIQTARASGMKEFPLPYVMTNCHNSLCAVGGTINEDDHAFGLSAAKRYGGIYVPTNLSVIHTYAREMLATCGGMILGSDSHTRYGALGTMGFGEGGGELVKQLLENTYDVDEPEVVLVYLENAPRKGIGPHDLALALVKELFPDGFVKNKVLEFAGPGIRNLSVDFRCAVDAMTTETACLSSIWETDEAVKAFYETHNRPYAYEQMAPYEGAGYDAMVKVDLSKLESMIALPFHPSNAYTVHEFQARAKELLRQVEEDAKKRYPNVDIHLTDKVTERGVQCDQGVIAGCVGGLYDNLTAAADILKGGDIGKGLFSLSLYPGSQPIALALAKNGTSAELMEYGALMKPSFCGPCFGAGEVPSNNGFSIRHTTRNFPNREGSKPKDGQAAFVALMDARSIAATAHNGGILTAATDLDYEETERPYKYEASCYEKRVYNGFAKPCKEVPLKLGPNITDWPKMPAMPKHLLLELAAVIHDEVTTTDELIPSGETSSYRSNPLKLSEFTLSRRAPEYVKNAKRIAGREAARRAGVPDAELLETLEACKAKPEDVVFATVLFAKRPGDGSAREQAASCQKVLGSFANIAYEYCTKRYRSNCINWGIVPFTIAPDVPFPYETGDLVFVPDVAEALQLGKERVDAVVLCKDGRKETLPLELRNLSEAERTVLLDGCLMNHYARRNA